MDREILWVNEGAVMSDAGHIIMTSFIDLRQPDERTPTTDLVRGCERKYALEDCETLMISSPARYRSLGEKLIQDIQEGLAKEETTITSQETAAQAARRLAVSDLGQALELTDSPMRPTYKETHTRTKTHSKSLEFGGGWWILSTSIRPDDENWDNWRSTLPNNYDHVSYIGQPTKFAQALAHMVAEQIGPRVQEGSLTSTIDGTKSEETKHKSQWVMHGPVVYVDSVYEMLNGITDEKTQLAAAIFSKSREYAAMKEYRFAVLNEGAEKETVLLQISGMMRDALKQSRKTLTRPALKPPRGKSRESAEPLSEARKALKPTHKVGRVRRRSTKREEWRSEIRGPDGQLQSKEVELRESISEKEFTQSENLESEKTEKPSRSHLDSHAKVDAHLVDRESPNLGDDIDDGVLEQSATKEIAREEFEWDESRSQEDQSAVPVMTCTGRVYKSFEEMLSDPTYPMRPLARSGKKIRILLTRLSRPIGQLMSWI